MEKEKGKKREERAPIDRMSWVPEVSIKCSDTGCIPMGAPPTC